MAMKLPINSKTLKVAAKAGAFIGGGAVAAQIGSEAAKRMSAGIATFAAKSPTNEAIVDLAAGVLLAALAHLALVKFKVKGAAGAAPLMVAGAIVSAVAPLAKPHIEKLQASILSHVGAKGAGGYHYKTPRFAAGYAGVDIPQLGPAGFAGMDVPMAGGMPASMDVPFYR